MATSNSKPPVAPAGAPAIHPVQEAANKEIDALIVDTGIELDKLATRRFKKMRLDYQSAQETLNAAQEAYHKTVAKLDRTRDAFWANLAEEHELTIKEHDYAINTDKPRARVMQLPPKAVIDAIIQRTVQDMGSAQAAGAEGTAVEDPEAMGPAEQQISDELDNLSDEDKARLAEKLAAAETDAAGGDPDIGGEDLPEAVDDPNICGESEEDKGYVPDNGAGVDAAPSEEDTHG